VKRFIVLGLILLLAVGCGATDKADQADDVSPTSDVNEAGVSPGEGLEPESGKRLETFSSFSYEAQKAMGFCLENFLEANISRTDQDQFEFSATLVEEASGDEGQPCLETGMVNCLVAESLQPRILDGDESRLVVDTFASLAFGDVPDWCEDIDYEPCRIDLYSWEFEEGEVQQALGDVCYQQHLTEDSQTALQQLLIDLAGQSVSVSSEEKVDPGGINQG
jgi:hypothetical protein